MTDVIFKNVDPQILEKLAKLMRPARAELLPAEWTADAAEVLLRDLGPAARRLYVTVAEAGGRIDASVLRGPDGSKSLKGLTGPVTKALERLSKAGKIPTDLPVPVTAEYDPSIRAWRKTAAFVMPSALVPLFQAASERLG